MRTATSPSCSASSEAKIVGALPAEDAAAHYDLGLAFKEMGLVDEAIAEFQIALRCRRHEAEDLRGARPLLPAEGQFNIAEKVLRRGSN
jgi:tetratricopeptide (TPR) repeat protein